MAVFSELRYPTARRAKLITEILAVVLFFLVATATISGILLFQILRPPKTPTTLDLNFLLGHPTSMTFTLPQGGSRAGWFFPGLRGAPAILVCHGYESQRADVLTLVTALQEHRFNVFLFDFSGHGTSPGYTTLGYSEMEQLQAAIRALSSRNDIDTARFGVWGTDLGAYAALSAAISNARIAALAVDSVYDEPRELLRLEVSRTGLGALPLVTGWTGLGFYLFTFRYHSQPPLSARLGRLNGVPKLFISVRDNPSLSRSTLRLFQLSPEPRQHTELRASFGEMSDEERRAYESLIVNFFLENLPPASRAAR